MTMLVLFGAIKTHLCRENDISCQTNENNNHSTQMTKDLMTNRNIRHCYWWYKYVFIEQYEYDKLISTDLLLSLVIQDQ